MGIFSPSRKNCDFLQTRTDPKALKENLTLNSLVFNLIKLR